MDRLDDDVIRKELEGIASDELVYVIKDEKGKEVVGLSKVGIDESCNILAHKGEVIREESCDWQILGSGEDQEGLFVVKAARFAVNPDGGEVRLDQVIGTKRQPLYYEAAQLLTLDTPCPGKKPIGKDGKRRTFREMLEQEKGYLEWMADNFRDEATADFCKRILNGEDATVQPGRQFNPFWFEHGSMKAARNARSRLVSADVKAMVIARAKQAGKQKVVDQRADNGDGPGGAPAPTPPPASPASEEAPREAISPEVRKLVFAEAAKGGITKETFPQFYLEVTGRAAPYVDVYQADVQPLLAAAAQRITLKAKAREAQGAGAVS
jgi:hypothetical protein